MLTHSWGFTRNRNHIWFDRASISSLLLLFDLVNSLAGFFVYAVGIGWVGMKRNFILYSVLGMYDTMGAQWGGTAL